MGTLHSLASLPALLQTTPNFVLALSRTPSNSHTVISLPCQVSHQLHTSPLLVIASLYLPGYKLSLGTHTPSASAYSSQLSFPPSCLTVNTRPAQLLFLPSAPCSFASVIPLTFLSSILAVTSPVYSYVYKTDASVVCALQFNSLVHRGD